MKQRWTLLLLVFSLLILTQSVQAQKDNIPIGARSAAMGGASVCLSDFWSVHNNQAGMASYNEMAVGIYGENRFLLKELSQGAFGFVMPVKKAGVFGISYNYFGYSLYQESKAGLSYAMAFGKRISAGVQLDYINLHQGEDYGNANIFTFEVGVRAELIKNLILGVHVYNPIHVKISKYGPERVPVIFKAGLAYNFSDKAIIAIETEKDLSNKARFRAGVEYHVVKPVYLRIGIGTAPYTNSFGLGLEFGAFKADISASRHQVLGFSPQLSLSYSFKKRVAE
jgi:hypothetical protein